MLAHTVMRDTFKIHIEEPEKDYLVTAELPGITKEEAGINDVKNIFFICHA